MNTILHKNFWKSLIYKQNDYHRYGVFRHSAMVVYHLIKMKQYKMLPAGVMHDFGKPFVANPDAKDIAKGNGELSFTNHEEISYLIIKRWSFVSDYSKQIVRHHYLLRGMSKAKYKGQLAKHRRLERVWNGLSPELQKDLALFLKADDLAKK